MNNTISSSNWFVRTLTSSIGQKVVMALTGLFLVLFLVVHLSGNFQLLKSDGGQAFNEYAQFMATFPPVRIISYLNFFFITLHIVQALLLTQKNRAARPVGYAYPKSSDNAQWRSLNMGILGSVILLFLVVHLWNFWYQMHFGTVNLLTYDPNKPPVKDLYTVVKAAFSNPIWVGFYVISMLAVAHHLLHGFWSAFQTLGLNHQKYTPVIKTIGFTLGVLVPIGYAAIPVIMFLMK